MKKFLVALFVVLAATIMVHGMADAKVAGECYNCHTMHNSQDGAPVAVANALWDGGTAPTGDTTAEPNGYLLVVDCIGCHSAVSGTIQSVGSTDIPIVRTQNDPAGNYLAGGNFYYSDNDDAKGHNISTADATINPAPGLAPEHHGAGCSPSGCHMSLVNAEYHGSSVSPCQGCHYKTFHHGDPVDETACDASTTAKDPTYRFLTGHHFEAGTWSAGCEGYVVGVEDSDWEDSTGGVDHNYYKGYDQSSAANATLAREHAREEKTISSFCSNCHDQFHNIEVEHDGVVRTGTGPGSPWLRHPVDQALPSTGEFSSYSYSIETPVAYETLPTVVANIPQGDEAGPVVACVSCHRTHASQYDDMLRFDYSAATAGGSGSGGCLNCHSAK
jgi:hypothetical protein